MLNFFQSAILRSVFILTCLHAVLFISSFHQVGCVSIKLCQKKTWDKFPHFPCFFLDRPLVDQSLTTKNVYMMSRDGDDGKYRVFSFRRWMISEKSDAEIENQSFIRTTIVLEEELKNNARLATRIYLSNLKRTNSSFVLRNDFLCILDANWNGNIKETRVAVHRKKSNKTFHWARICKCLQQKTRIFSFSRQKSANIFHKNAILANF